MRTETRASKTDPFEITATFNDDGTVHLVAKRTKDGYVLGQVTLSEIEYRRSIITDRPRTEILKRTRPLTIAEMRTVVEWLILLKKGELIK